MNIRNKALFIAALFIISLACNKERAETKGDNPEQIKLSAVKSAFSDIQEKGIAPTSGAPNSFFNQPDWSGARWVENEYGKPYWQIPLTSKAKGERVMSFINPYDGKKLTVFLPEPQMIAHYDSVSGVMISVAQSVPYKGIGSDDVTSVMHQFSGEINLYEWDGHFKYGTQFKDGKRYKMVRPALKEAEGKNARIGSWECVDVTSCKYVASCTYYDGSSGAIFKEVSDRSIGDQGLCFPPTTSPKDVLIALPYDWQLPSFYQWHCGDWQYHSQEWDVLCNWIEDPQNPNPNPPIPGQNHGQGKDDEGGSIFANPDPCAGKAKIQALLNNGSFTTGMTAVRQKLSTSDKEWGTPVWVTAVPNIHTAFTAAPYENGTSGDWAGSFQWEAGHYMIGTIHNHPVGYPPSAGDISSMVAGAEDLTKTINFGSGPSAVEQRAEHTLWYMNNTFVTVVSNYKDYFILPNNWHTLWIKHSEYRKNAVTFNNKLIQAEIKHGDVLAGLIEMYGDGITVYQAVPGTNNFVPYKANASGLGPAQQVPCP